MIYIDTSALLKLVKVDEIESAALQEYLAGGGIELISSALLAVEARRGMLRLRPAGIPKVDLLLNEVVQLDVSAAVIEDASRLPDPMLRSPDAIHLATALLIREDIELLLTYDDRLAEAARAHGIPTAAPA